LSAHHLHNAAITVGVTAVEDVLLRLAKRFRWNPYSLKLL
jgi:hypothetical protein